MNKKSISAYFIILKTEQVDHSQAVITVNLKKEKNNWGSSEMTKVILNPLDVITEYSQAWYIHKVCIS